jgi:peptide-methionine (S)-S-oxide reductase
MPGVVRTRVGYAGGTTENPTYHNLGDHTETIQIEYDPSVVTYEELLDNFWSSHNPARQPWSRQYASIVFYHNEEQRRLAEETREREAARIGSQVLTEIIPASEFYLAEAYHQKYRLRRAPDLEREFSAIYPSDDDFVASTAVARVNGYLGGYGTCERLQEEIGELGLSSAASERLLRSVCGASR